jgi:hypothetical protein
MLISEDQEFNVMLTVVVVVIFALVGAGYWDSVQTKRFTAACATSCEVQFGSSYQARVLRHDNGRACDCVGSDGLVRVPQR